MSYRRRFKINLGRRGQGGDETGRDSRGEVASGRAAPTGGDAWWGAIRNELAVVERRRLGDLTLHRLESAAHDRRPQCLWRFARLHRDIARLLLRANETRYLIEQFRGRAELDPHWLEARVAKLIAYNNQIDHAIDELTLELELQDEGGEG